MMKRAVAILGPTPMFIRWAIERQCPLRELESDRLPEMTFRQLRTVREASLAQQQGRVKDGFCLHPQASSVDPQQVLGFSMAESLELLGGISVIESNCRACPANANFLSADADWAGCFGLLSIDLRFSLDRIVRGECGGPAELDSAADAIGTELKNAIAECKQGDLANSQRWDLRQLIGRLAENSPSLGAGYIHRDHDGDKCPSLWVRLWQQKVPDDEPLRLLQAVLEEAKRQLPVWIKDRQVGGQQSETSAGKGAQEPERERKAEVPTSSLELQSQLELREWKRDLNQLLIALRLCRQHDLKLHLELIPAGVSDGVTWRLFPHCGSCKDIWLDRSQPCVSCGPETSYQNEVKLKVLGLRPYLRLAKILGVNQVEQLVKSF